MFAEAGLSFQRSGAAALVYACSTISSPDNFVAIPFFINYEEGLYAALKFRFFYELLSY